ncbi:MAG: Xylose isomerase domain protein barrel [Deltaproteobacteria bacterium]|nr:Xylose isomerase domain protein barrel [Deltaproteobacteria bacterium]
MLTTPIHVNVPYPLLKDRTGFLIELSLNPEIYLSGNVLDTIKKEEFAESCKLLKKAGLSITFHAPYLDMSPGSPDLKIRAVVLERMNQVMDMAEIAGPSAIVVHGGYDKWRFDGNMDMWLKNSLEVWPSIVRRAGKMGTRLAMENVFDDIPEPITKLLNAIDSPHFAHCFDVGHFRLFSKVTIEEWFRQLGKRMIEVHIHDNNGGRDEHLPPGEGDIDFAKFFSLIRNSTSDVIYTIEPHKEEHLRKNLEVLSKYLDLATLS